MITLEDWALIRRLAAEGVPKKQIAERLGISRTTVVKAVTSFSPFEGRVRTLGSAGSYVMLVDTEGIKPKLLLQAVPETPRATSSVSAMGPAADTRPIELRVPDTAVFEVVLEYQVEDEYHSVRHELAWGSRG